MKDSAQNVDDQQFHHYTLQHRVVSWISRSLFDRLTYTSRHGLTKGMRRKGGLGWLPEFAAKSAQTAEHTFWEQLDLENLVIYDVGAYHGLLTLSFARQARQVVSYEPNTRNHARLLENLRLNNLTNVTIRKLGIGSEAQTATLVASPLMLGGASIEPATVAGLRGSRADLISESISVTTLDDDIREHSLPPPDFIKIDIEGQELAALIGARQTIVTYKPALFLEMHGESMNLKRQKVAEIVACLNGFGYREIRHLESETRIEPSNSAVAVEGHLYCPRDQGARLKT